MPSLHVSQRGQYAVKAAVRLALSYGGAPVQGREIAAFGGIPVRYVEQVLHDLRQAGLVASRRGKNGGYALVRHPAAVTFIQVLEAVEGGLARDDGVQGADAADPLVQPVWNEIRETVRDLLGRATLAEAAGRAANGDMYYI